MPDVELFRVSVEARILQLMSTISDFPNAGCRVATTFAGRSVVLQIGPEPEDQEHSDRTPCERDCLKIIAAQGPLTRSEILKALSANGTLWGESTVANALANLHSLGLVENSRKRGGYYLPKSGTE